MGYGHRVNNYVEDKATQIVFVWKFHELRILKTFNVARSRFPGQFEEKKSSKYIAKSA